MPLEVLFEDNHCLAVNKPAPLLTQAPPGIPSLEALAKAYLKEKYAKLGNVYLAIPHRLDRPASGVIVFGRNTKAAQRLAEQFRDRTVKKTYWALVEGILPEKEGVWIDWLQKIKEEARTEKVDADTPGAREARLGFRILNQWEDATFLELEPLTGRMHQIRAQAALRGHPVCGDELYGGKKSFGPPSAIRRERVIALHARSLLFLHPMHYEPIEVSAPLPDYWPSWVTQNVRNGEARE